MRLQATGVGVRIDGATILDRIDLDVPATGMTALLGPNGSGKSTLLRVLAGIDSPTTGEVLLEGAPLHAMPRRARARAIAVVEQEAATDLALRVRDVVMLGRLPHQGALGGATHGDERVAEDALRRAGAEAWAEREFASLSGGERQRVRLAAALAQEPRVLVLDEPTNHLDPRASLEVIALLRSLADDGVCVLAALHDLTLAGYADTAAMLDRGTLVAAGPVASVLEAERIRDVYGVRAVVAPHPLTGRLSVQVASLPTDWAEHA